jgi:hypothetical protein
MKQYVFDQLREEDHDLLHEFLDNNAEKTVFDDVFRLPLPEALYTDVQKEHKDCWPFYFAVNLSQTTINFELLIRSKNVLRCSCIRYADRAQRDYILDYADRMLEDLKMKI